jgi:hypothetical protein
MKLIFPTFDILKFDAFTASLRFDLWLWEGVRMLNFTITTSHFFQNIEIGFLVHHYTTTVLLHQNIESVFLVDHNYKIDKDQNIEIDKDHYYKSSWSLLWKSERRKE